MLIICKNFNELDFEQLTLVHQESIGEEGKKCFPYDGPERQRLKAEDDFEDYLRRDFFNTTDARYCIWCEGGVYLSAMRLEPYKDGILICGLETKPSCRKNGYATSLLRAALANIGQPVYSHIAKNNAASIAVHVRCGFRHLCEGARLLDGSVSSFYDTYLFIN